MIAIVLSTVLTTVIVLVGWFLDQVALGCTTRVRALLGMVILAIGSWICLTIRFALALKIPGAYGPVQYWVGDMAAHRFISGPRTIALFAIWGGLPLTGLLALVTVISIVISPQGARAKSLVIPLVAVTIYVLSWWLFIRCGFYPSA